MTERLPYWTMTEVAEYSGLAHGTISSYMIRKQMPEPDFVAGRRTWLWRPETIKAWRAKVEAGKESNDG